MKDKIVEILKDNSQAAENLSDGYGLRGMALFEFDFDYVADKIVDLINKKNTGDGENLIE